MLAQGVEQRGPRIERQPVLGPVDAQHDVEGSGRRVGTLRGRLRCGAGHEWPCGQGAAGSCGEFQQVSSCRIEAGHLQAS